MNYFSPEVLHATRNVIGFIIFIIAFLLLLKKTSGFQNTLDAEMIKNHYINIFSRLMALEELNKGSLHILKQLNGVANSQRNVPEPLIHKGNPLQFFSEKNLNNARFVKTVIADHRLSSVKDSPEKIEISNSDLSKSENHENMQIPQAEADFMLKFNRLYQLNQHKNNHYAAQSAIRR